jgi:hypothetical protein
MESLAYILLCRLGKGKTRQSRLEMWRERWWTSMLSHHYTSKIQHQDSLEKLGPSNRPSADSQGVRFLKGWVWPGSLLQQCPSSILLMLRECRRQQRQRLQLASLELCQWSSR